MVNNKRRNKITTARKILFVVLSMLLFDIFFLLYKKYILFVLFTCLIFFLSALIYRLITEELVVYYAFRQGGKIKYDKIIELMGKKGKGAINRLDRKKIIEKIDDDIILKVDDFTFSVTKIKMVNRKSQR